MEQTLARKVNCWKCCRFAVGAAALMPFQGVAASAQAVSIVSVCVKTSDGSMRMLLSSIPSHPCQAGEQFVQWNVQGSPGPKGDPGGKGLRGDKGDKGDVGAAGQDGQDGKDGKDGKQGPAGLAGPPGPQGSAGLTAVPGHGGAGGSSGPFYVPFDVLNRDGKVIFEVNATSAGGHATFRNLNGGAGAEIGINPDTQNGALDLWNPSQNAKVTLALDSQYRGHLEFSDFGKVKAELSPGTKGTMGLRIWNESENEVVTLEELSTGGGGLMIHNDKGGVAATIAPNSFGVGVFHGITAVMPVNHP